MVNDSTTSSGLCSYPRIPVSNICFSNKWDPESRVYWGQKEPPQKSISSSSSLSSYHVVLPEYWDIHEKIKSAFYDVNLSPYEGLILQFWALVKTTTHGKAAQLDEQTFQRLIMDLTVYKGVSFYNKAISCGLTTCIILPVFYLPPQANTRYCLGVVQCCMKKRTGLDFVFNQLKLSLANVGLGTCSVQNYPYEALVLVCESKCRTLPLVHVWILIALILGSSLVVQLHLLPVGSSTTGGVSGCIHTEDDVDYVFEFFSMAQKVERSETDYESDLYSEEGEEDHDVIMPLNAHLLISWSKSGMTSGFMYHKEGMCLCEVDMAWRVVYVGWSIGGNTLGPSNTLPQEGSIGWVIFCLWFWKCSLPRKSPLSIVNGSCVFLDDASSYLSNFYCGCGLNGYWAVLSPGYVVKKTCLTRDASILHQTCIRLSILNLYKEI
ncbi:hypothetical protein Tco_1251668 [Tanacetum coccineum]